jgi:hypothetical protein
VVDNYISIGSTPQVTLDGVRPATNGGVKCGRTVFYGYRLSSPVPGAAMGDDGRMISVCQRLKIDHGFQPMASIGERQAGGETLADLLNEPIYLAARPSCGWQP